MNNKKLILLSPLIIMAMVITIFLLALNKKDDNQIILKAKPFPVFSLTTLQGTELINESTFTNNQESKYTLLNVWASWCAICKTEHQYLLTLSEQGVNIIGLNYRDEQQAAKSLINQMGNPYQQIIVDKKGILALDLGVIGTPESYLIDHKGWIVARVNGVLNQALWAKHFQPFFEKTE